jgi:hypothetical protein
MDQAAANVAPEDGPKQSKNRMETGFPIQEASVFLRDKVSGWRESKEHAGLLLQALCDLTIESNAPTEEGFTNKDLAVRAVRLGGQPASWGVSRDHEVADIEVCRSTVNNAWKRAEALWERKREGILERFQERGWTAIPELFRDGDNVGGRGRTTRYKLVFHPRPPDATREDDGTHRRTDTGDIRYYTEDVESAGILARSLAKGWLLTGWRGSIFVALVVLGVILGTAIALAGMGAIAFAPTGKTLTASLVIAIIAGGALWSGFRPIGLLARDRITMAPPWLQSIRDPWEDRLLELRRLPGHEVNHIFLTRYAATCPTCGADIHVSPGRKEFHDRLIGRCARAPNEHVFSFDHVTRTGMALRRTALSRSRTH